jgi:capsular exopolysaccharide synthesis family protein
MQYERLKKTTPAGNPMMFSLKNEIDQIRPTIIENIQNQRSSLQASKNDLYASNNMYASILKSIPQKERELLEISRQQSIKNDAYAFLLHKREETALTYAATVSDSRIIDKAVASLDPTNPKKLIVFPVSIAIALFLGIAIVSGKELLNNKILFRSDIESLSKIPVVAEIVKVKAKSPLVVNNLKYAYVADQFRQLRAAVGLFGSHINRKSLLITSSITGEGKSFISNNLALSLALSGKKVVLLDMDLRNPRTSEVFGLQNQNGIAEVLEDRCELADVVYSSEYNNLFIVPSGTTKLNTAEILLNGNLEDVFNRLENKFDYLIVDTAPVDPVMDAYVISRYCDTTLFIVKHNFTPKAIIEMLDKNNEIKALKKVAIVFNAVKPRGFFIKGFGYGYGYGYKKVYSDNLMK